MDQVTLAKDNTELYETMRMIEACKRRIKEAKAAGSDWTKDHTDFCIHLHSFYLLVKKDLR